MERMILALLASALVATGAQAQPALVDKWDSDRLVQALQDLGASNVQVTQLDGKPAIMARTRDGLNVGLYAKGCDTPAPAAGPNCHAMQSVISFDTSQRTDRAALADQLNHGFALGKFTVESDGSIRGSRYFLFDGGVSLQNLRSEMVGFFTVGQLASQTVWPATAHR